MVPICGSNKNASKPSCWSKTILDSHDATADLDFNHDDELVVHLAGSNSSEAITDLKNEFNVTKELSLHFKNKIHL